MHHDSLKPFEGTGCFTDEETQSELDIPLLSPTDGEDNAKDKALDDMADLFMPQSSHLSTIPDAYRDAPTDAWSSSDTDTAYPPARPQWKRLRPRDRLRAPSRFLPS